VESVTTIAVTITSGDVLLGVEGQHVNTGIDRDVEALDAWELHARCADVEVRVKGERIHVRWDTCVALHVAFVLRAEHERIDERAGR